MVQLSHPYNMWPPAPMSGLDLGLRVTRDSESTRIPLGGLYPGYPWSLRGASHWVASCPKERPQRKEPRSPASSQHQQRRRWWAWKRASQAAPWLTLTALTNLDCILTNLDCSPWEPKPEAPAETSWIPHSQKLCSRVCCFKLLNVWVICMQQQMTNTQTFI